MVRDLFRLKKSISGWVKIFTCTLVVAYSLTVPSSAFAQNDTASDSVSAPRRHNAGGAFLRSVIIPGWGQAAVGSPNRGGFYFAVESMNLWMILKTSRTLKSARNSLSLRREQAKVRISNEGFADNVDIESLIDKDPGVQDAEELVESRSQQKEDWIALGIFFLVLGGADAFVAAHLADFPEPLETKIRSSPDMGMELMFSLSFDPFRPNRSRSVRRGGT